MKKAYFLILFGGWGAYNHLFAQQNALGALITINGDTLPVNFILPTSNKELAKFTYREIEIENPEGGKKIIKPRQIKGYKKGKERFETLSFYDTTTKSHSYVFAKVIVKGKVELYYTVLFARREVEVYFFKKREESHYHIFRENEIMDLGEGPYKIYAFNRDSVFEQYFSVYFRECDFVSRKTKLGYYTTEHFETMFKEYEQECH